MTKLIEDLAAELIRQAYAEGYRNGRQDAEKIPRLTPEIGDKLKQLKQARAIMDGAKLTNERAMETPQQARDRIVEQAKKDVAELSTTWRPGCPSLNFPPSAFDPETETVNFSVDRNKRTVVCYITYWSDMSKRTQTSFRGIAKCAPGDCFNVHIGKAIALRRALGLDIPFEYLNVPNPTEVRVGDVMKVSVDDGTVEVKPVISTEGYGRLNVHLPGRSIQFPADYAEIIDDSREEASEYVVRSDSDGTDRSNTRVSRRQR